jgi:hypothetical protein
MHFFLLTNPYIVHLLDAHCDLKIVQTPKQISFKTLLTVAHTICRCVISVLITLTQSAIVVITLTQSIVVLIALTQSAIVLIAHTQFIVVLLLC